MRTAYSGAKEKRSQDKRENEDYIIEMLEKVIEDVLTASENGAAILNATIVLQVVEPSDVTTPHLLVIGPANSDHLVNMRLLSEAMGLLVENIASVSMRSKTRPVEEIEERWVNSVLTSKNVRN